MKLNSDRSWKADLSELSNLFRKFYVGLFQPRLFSCHLLQKHELNLLLVGNIRIFIYQISAPFYFKKSIVFVCIVHVYGFQL